MAEQLADLPPYWHLVVKNGNFTFLLLRVHIGTSGGRSTPQHSHLVFKNGNFTFLLLRVHIGRTTGRSPPLLASGGQEWQFYISTVKSSYWQIKWQIYPPGYWHLVVKNGNFTFILLDLMLAVQLVDLTPKGNASWDIYYWMYLATIVDSSRKGWNLLLFLNN